MKICKDFRDIEVRVGLGCNKFIIDSDVELIVHDFDSSSMRGRVIFSLSKLVPDFIGLFANCNLNEQSLYETIYIDFVSSLTPIIKDGRLSYEM